MSDFKVSVIIPVYNAAAYVSQAVESALAQPETAEVQLIEDGSPDNALEICQTLASEHDKIRLLRHPNGENRGAGASRNLGMRNARFDYIAFLDADDYYLPGRFSVASEVFRLNPDCEGVYEAVAMQVESIEGVDRWQAAGKSDRQLQTMLPGVPPEEVAEAVIKGDRGYFQLNGLVIRKSVLEKSGLMNEGLRLHQDTEFIQRVGLTSRLLPGRLDMPVTMWRVHPENRVSAPRSMLKQYKERMKHWLSLYHWVKRHGSRQQQSLVREAALSFNRSHKYFAKFPRKVFPDTILMMSRQLRLLAYPELWIDRSPPPSGEKTDRNSRIQRSDL